MRDPNGLQPLLDRLYAMELRLREVEDRDAIHQTFVNLQTATDQRNKEAYAACFTEDGEWSGVSGRAVGRTAIMETMAKVFAKPWANENERTYHIFACLEIKLDGDKATARAPYQHIRMGENGHPTGFHLGHYDAILHRTVEGWRFKRRASFLDLPYFAPTYQLEGLGAAS